MKKTILLISTAALLLGGCKPGGDWVDLPVKVVDSIRQFLKYNANNAEKAPQLADIRLTPVLPADLVQADAASYRTSLAYEPLAQKRVYYYNRSGVLAEKPVRGGFYREVIGYTDDGRVVVQNKYQDSGRVQTAPFAVKKGGSEADFDYAANDSLTVWFDSEGEAEGAAEFRKGDIHGWSADFHGRQLLARHKADKAGNGQVLLYDNGHPFAYFKVSPSEKVTVFFYANGSAMLQYIEKESQEPETNTWDEQGKAVDPKGMNDKALKARQLAAAKMKLMR